MKRSGPLQRRTPMRRRPPIDTEFAELRESEPPLLVFPPVAPPRRVMTMRFVFNPQPKHEYVRSRPLLDVCRQLCCQHCWRAGPDAGVCAAHSNWHPHHKGGAIKADDNRVAALCMACHYAIDQGSELSEVERKRLWWPAHVRTVCALQRLGRWPKGVPLPDIETCPWELEYA